MKNRFQTRFIKSKDLSKEKQKLDLQQFNLFISKTQVQQSQRQKKYLSITNVDYKYLIQNQAKINRYGRGVSTRTSSRPRTIDHASIQTKQLHKQLRQRRKLNDITKQNQKMLKRLFIKHSQYSARKMNERWKKQKQLASNIANFPFIIRDDAYSSKGKRSQRRSVSRQEGSIRDRINLQRTMLIDGKQVTIQLTLDQFYLTIVAKKLDQNSKIIKINRQQAIQFISSECNNNIQLIFDRLIYDQQHQILYLLPRESMDLCK